MDDKHVLITGGTGFIYSNRLTSDIDVITVDDFYLGDPDNHTNGVMFVES